MFIFFNIVNDINPVCLSQIDTEIAVTRLVKFCLYVYLWYRKTHIPIYLTEISTSVILAYTS